MKVINNRIQKNSQIHKIIQMKSKMKMMKKFKNKCRNKLKLIKTML